MFTKKENTQKLTLAEVLRPLAQLCLNLSGKNGLIWLNALTRFLRKENPWLNLDKWKVWTYATMGLRIPLAEMVQSLVDQGFKIQYSEHYPMDLLVIEDQLEFSPIENYIVAFALVSPKDLGLKPGWTKRQLLDTAKRRGLEPMLSGDIIEILFQKRYELRKYDKAIDIAMEPIKINNGPAMFCIVQYETKHLGYHNGDLAQKWDYPGNVNNKHLFRIRPY